MKNLYITPKLEAQTLQTRDVITVSFGETGSAKPFSFKDIINGTAGWLEI